MRALHNLSVDQPLRGRQARRGVGEVIDVEPVGRPAALDEFEIPRFNGLAQAARVTGLRRGDEAAERNAAQGHLTAGVGPTTFGYLRPG